MPKDSKKRSRASKEVSSVSGDRVPREVSAQERLEWTLAADRAWQTFERCFLETREYRHMEEASVTESETETRAQWRRFFSTNGVCFGDGGRPSFPVDACVDVDAETLIERVSMKVHSFFRWLQKTTGEMICNAGDEYYEVGLRCGFGVSGDMDDPSQLFVAVVMLVDMNNMKVLRPFQAENPRDIVRIQRPKVWARWEAGRATKAARAELKRCEALERATVPNVFITDP